MGSSCSQIMASLKTIASTISRWKKRFEEEGMAGLSPRYRVADRKAPPRVQARIVPIIQAETGKRLLWLEVTSGFRRCESAAQYGSFQYQPRKWRYKRFEKVSESKYSDWHRDTMKLWMTATR